MKTTMADVIQNVNVLLDNVYKYSLENPKENININVIKYDWCSQNLSITDLFDKLSNTRLYCRLDYKTRTITIENSIVLKFKTKKVKYTKPNRYNSTHRESDECLSVVNIEVDEYNKYLDMTPEEFKYIIKKENIEYKEKETNKNKQNAIKFLEELNKFGMNFEQFNKLQIEYKYLSYESQNIIGGLK